MCYAAPYYYAHSYLFVAWQSRVLLAMNLYLVELLELLIEAINVLIVRWRLDEYFFFLALRTLSSHELHLQPQ